MPEPAPPTPALPRWLVYALIFGLYLTLRGYHSRDGDQAYRLPLLLHRQDPALFADDPFVKAFDAFNPHRGYLALLDAASRPLGLSAGLAALFALTFAGTAIGIDRLARAVWPAAGPKVGVVAVALVLIAKAGNVGTNHLFESMLLDRLIGFALGWVALALAVENPRRGWWAAPLAVGPALLVHPSVGLQLAMLLGTGWVGWSIWPRASGVDRRLAARGLIALGLALAPGLALHFGRGSRLFDGLPPGEFWLLSVELQSPQHMLPHLWRLPQWLAWACYPVLGLMALWDRRSQEPTEGAGEWPEARIRLACLLVINLIGLGLAWVAVEGLHDLRITLFQPFRMATVFRGLALVALSGRVLALWRRGGGTDRARAVLLTVGLAGDWTMVVAAAFDVAAALGDRFRLRSFGWAVLAVGLAFLARHDTESGHRALLAALAGLAVVTWVGRGRACRITQRRATWAFAASWAVPLAALIAPILPSAWADALVSRCRFAAIPADDVERLAVWCRDHTPTSAVFIGPPGPKTFRLWSLRSLAFNRAASPYHAGGLADWSARFRDHVDFEGSTAAFVRAYLSDRHGLERRYQALSDRERAALAVRQGATHVIAAAPAPGAHADGPLRLLHAEGRYAVYCVQSRISRQDAKGRNAEGAKR